MDTRVTQHTDPAPPYPDSHKLILLGENQMQILYLYTNYEQSDVTTKLSNAQALTFVLKSHKGNVDRSSSIDGLAGVD